MNNSRTKFRVLNIEGSESDYELIKNELLGLISQLIIQRVHTWEDYELHLKAQSWDLVISDYRTSHISSPEALTLLRKLRPETPFILVSGPIGEEIVADMMKAGIEDFVSKSHLERMIPAINRILREHDAKEKEKKATRKAMLANGAKEQMLAIVSHDIKNPLSAIQLEAQMLIRAVGRHGKSILGEEVKIQANRILKTTDRLKTMITDLLDKSHPEDGLSSLNKSEVEVGLLFQNVVESSMPLIREKEITVRTYLTPLNSIVILDRNKMFQVLSNLLTNAIKFTPHGGVVELHFKQDHEDHVFMVIDSGHGLGSKELPKVFDKYWTGKINGSGTGLGLFICKTIVEAHGGAIMAGNAEGSGAKFTFTVPRYENSQGTNPMHGRKTVLVLDDDEDLREVICWALGKEGHDVESMASPYEVLERLKSGKSNPHLILANYQMEGMTGHEFLLQHKELRSTNNCPVVIISASPRLVEEEVRRDLYQEVLAKPIDLDRLVNDMDKYLIQ